MPAPGQELASLDFESLIGGPLIAVVKAQAMSANTTVDFIKSVGFKKTDDDFFEGGENSTTQEPIYVSFKYHKEVKPFQPQIKDDNGNVTQDEEEAKYRMHELRVPILTILPIPYLRVEETTIDFNAKINSVTSINIDSQVNFSSETEKKAGYFFSGVKMKSNFSYQLQTKVGNRVERTYTMNVHVRAVQDELPAGMERILSILEDAIISVPTGTPNDELSHPVG